MEDVKGTVTSLASLFPAEEAQKAARRVDEAIAEKQKELNHLQSFSSDNNTLLKLIQRLPDEISHDVMVPFGKAAFFPGSLRHTNEFFVLLGEGYYAERTSKQAFDILNRRGKALDSQMDSLKAMMLDLKAEATFFNNTAAESAEGLVEIREDYIEESPAERMSHQADVENSKEDSSEDADDEYARIMAKLDELEEEELAEESADGGDEEKGIEADLQHYPDHGPKMSKQHQYLRDPHMPQDGSSKGVTTYNTVEKPLLDSKFSKKVNVMSSPRDEISGATSKAVAGPQKVSLETTPGTSSARSKTFTGSIVERDQGLPTKTAGQNLKLPQLSGSNPSKPVSRFKMQKGGR